MRGFKGHPLCGHCFYKCCLFNFPKKNTCKLSDRMNKQATKDRQLFGPQNTMSEVATELVAVWVDALS